MSYEAECEAYAICGDPARDAADYEENARYNRYDGWGDTDPCAEYEDCTPHDADVDPDNAEVDAYLQAWIECERCKKSEGNTESAGNDDCPF